MPQLRLPLPGEPLTVILKPVGSRCNIDCLYCYDKRRELADVGNLLASHVRALCRLASGHPLDVILHGGEPLLASDATLEAIAEAFQHHDARVTFGLVTNALKLTAARYRGLLQMFPSLQVTVSYDGPGELSNYRRDFSGNQTQARVEEVIRELESYSIPISLITVATAKLAGREHILLDQVAQFTNVVSLKVTPCFDFSIRQSKSGKRLRSSETLAQLDAQTQSMAFWGLRPADYTLVVTRLARLWRDQGLFRRFLLEPFDSILMSSVGADSGYTDFSTRKQPFILTLSASGLLSTSDEFESSDALIGHVSELTEPVSHLVRTRLQPLWRSCDALMANCTECVHQSICRSGGLPDRLAFQATEHGDEYCVARRVLIDNLLALARQQADV